ncbi:MAG TPA: hypothetical protein VNJ09_07570 [Chthonomonadales bacterium]|nr:hypothetical protein [Chthonomonadales bacterium]
MRKRCHSRRGVALVVALAVVLELSMLVVGTQMQVVGQFKTSKTEQDYERALQMAEAGLNAYLNRLAHGPGSGANSALIPDFYQWSSDLTITQFKQQTRAGTLPGSPRYIYYPAGQTRQGYFAGHLGTPGSFVTIISFGWSNGVVRRVKAIARAFSIFDWAALWGLNPNQSQAAWDLSGGFTVVGAFGGEGRMFFSNNNEFWDGPSVRCTSLADFYTGNPNNAALIPPPNLLGPSSPNNPPGRIGWGQLANPPHRTYARSLGFPTADQAANEYSGNSSGLEYFRNNNHNATGLRYLVWQNNQPSTIRELTSTAYTVMAPGTYRLRSNVEWNPSKANLAAWGMQPSETFYGIRVHPGNYFLEQINMGPSDRLIIRTYNDADRTDPGTTNDPQYPLAPVISNDPPNPNGLPNARNVRFWIKNTATGPQERTNFEAGTVMQYPRYPSRFRCYIGAREEVNAHGSQSSPLNFYVNMLVYNGDTTSGYYGSIKFSSSVYLRGSLIAWYVSRAGSATVEKVAPELGPDDVLTYVVTDWTELQ